MVMAVTWHARGLGFKFYPRQAFCRWLFTCSDHLTVSRFSGTYEVPICGNERKWNFPDSVVAVVRNPLKTAHYIHVLHMHTCDWTVKWLVCVTQPTCTLKQLFLSLSHSSHSISFFLCHRNGQTPLRPALRISLLRIALPHGKQISVKFTGWEFRA